MIFRIIRSLPGQSNADIRHAFESTVARQLPLIIPLVRPGSVTGKILVDEQETAILDDVSQRLGVNIVYIAEAGAFGEFSQIVLKQVPPAAREKVRGNSVLCVKAGREKAWVLTGPEPKEGDAFLDYLYELCHLLSLGKKPRSYHGGPGLSLADLGAISSLIAALRSLIPFP